jgi:chorismate mutase/prephenate dehydratase
MDLTELREKIDGIDNEIVRLFTERMNTALEVAKYKKETSTPVLNKSREREIISRVTEKTQDDLQGYTKILFSMLFDLSRSYQQRYLAGKSEIAEQIEAALERTNKLFPSKAVVACQGVEGAYSQIACDKLFPLPSIMYFNRFEGVFQAVEKGLCQYGILPIENSSYGSVVEVYDLMKRYSFRIARSVKLRVSHVLLGKHGSRLSDVKEIFSHEQAIGQCSEFLKKLDVKVTVCENTAAAAKMVAESPRTDIAAISSASCAELYQLSTLADSVQNNDSNYTRFICISKNLEIYPGANRVSLMLSVPHKPGALYEVISKFSALGLNLTKLESRPIPGSDFEFMFYLDMDASVYSPELIQLLCELSSAPEQFVFLGSYSEI